MAVISISAIVTFFSGEEKLISRGENAVQSNHVVSFMFDCATGTLKGKVQASMKNKSYDVEIELNDEKMVSGGSCTCPRGQFRCHHMAALLVYGRDHVSRTDVTCQWKVKSSSRDRETTKIENLFHHPQQWYSATATKLKPEELEAIAAELTCLDPTGLQWLLSKEPDVVLSSHLVVADVFQSEQFLAASDKISFLRQVMAVTPEEVAQVEIMTRGQRLNPNWSLMRAGRLTASRFGDVIRACRRQSFPPSLISSLLGESNLTGVKAVQWGIEHEQQAVDEYVSSFDKQVAEVGLLLHESGVLAASPDRLEEPDGLLEVKCPYSCRNSSIAEALNDPKFCIGLNDKEQYALKTDHVYYDQCQGQLHISGRSHLSFYVWLPGGSMRVVVERDEEWAARNIPLLTDFYFDIFVNAYASKLQQKF